VTSVRDFGAFVDIGGIEGLLPISEVSYSRVEDLSELLTVGQQLELIVKRIDWAENKFSFSLRDTLADPWTTAAVNFPIGRQLTGKVSRLAQFGAFVTLDEGIDGLVHISRLGEGKRINHPREVLTVGQELSVTVEKVDSEQRRISLVPAGAEEVVTAGLGSLGDLLKASQNNRKKR
ncbi:MAG: S1 RNA-binding domain-containing protein, partial [Deltaproteobacteria bacterium]|nr:S1 RNA-binding domain-containing protein [Deltaproteobacteria bacterium]